MSSETAILEAALNYTRLGLIVHPLLNPNASKTNPKTGKEQSPGKGVLVKDWQKRENILTETEIKKYWGSGRSSYFDNANIGLQCEKRSRFDPNRCGQLEPWDMERTHSQISHG
jgi:hypothetical protein